MEGMPNYLDYYELFENWTHQQLLEAYNALTNYDLREELFEAGSPLLVFFIDIEKQEQLLLYFEDKKAV
jgi:hypothetical protein